MITPVWSPISHHWQLPLTQSGFVATWTSSMMSWELRFKPTMNELLRFSCRCENVLRRPQSNSNEIVDPPIARQQMTLMILLCNCLSFFYTFALLFGYREFGF